MATGPGGKEVDRVSVRVVPDTSKFASELRAFLNKIEREFSVKIPVEVDTSRIKAAAAKARKELGEHVEIQVRVNQSKIGAAVSAFRRLAQIDTSGIDMSMGRTETLIGNAIVLTGRLVDNLKAASKRSVEIAHRTGEIAKRVVNVRAHWRAVGAKLSQAAKSIKDIKADGFYRNMIKSSDAILGASIRLARFGVLATRMFGRVAGKAAKGAQSAISGISSAVGGAVSSLGKLGRTGWIVVGVLGLAAPAVGLLSTALLTLPALAFAAGAGIAAVALGMDGIKRAASQLKPEVTALKASLSKTFEKGLTPVFAQLEKLFPVLDRGLNQVAGGVISMAKEFTGVVTSAQGMSQIEGILNNTGKFFTQLGPMVRDGTSAFLTLGKAASDEFGQLASVLNGFASEFRSMVERITSDGSFKAGITGLSAVTSSLLSLLVKLFEAGVRVMAQVGGPLAALIDVIGDALVALMPALGTITNLFATVLTAALTAILPIIKTLMPAFEALAGTIGQLLVGAIQALAPILSAVAQIINDVLLVTLKALEPIIGPLIEFLIQFGAIVGQFLVDAFTMLQPLIADLAKFLAELFAAVAPLLPTLLNLAKVIFAALLDVLSKILPPIIRLAQVVFPILIAIVNLVVPAIAALVQILADILGPLAAIVGYIIDALIPVFNAVLEVVQNVWPFIEGLISGVLDVIIGLIRAFLGLITGDWSAAWDGIKQALGGALEAMLNAIAGVIVLIVDFFIELPGAILGALGDLGSLLWDAGKAILRGLLDGLIAAWDTVSGWVSDVGSWIADLKGPLPYDRRILIPAGNAIMAGLLNGMKTGFVPVMNMASGMADQLASSFAGTAIGSSWADSITEGTPAALGAVNDLMAATNASASTSWQGDIASDGFGGIGDAIAGALSQWEVRLDGGGLAKLVNKANTRKARRG